jgi:hypothetical protein
VVDQVFREGLVGMVSMVCVVLLVVPGGLVLRAQQPGPAPPGQMLSPDQLNGLVAPIALYPDPLLSQILVAATYPLELVQADQWLQRNPGMTGPALTQGALQQNWDPSVQALVVFPDLIKRLNQDIRWTTDLGNAFLAQQPDVMDAVQRMRQKAEQAGRLQSTPQEQVLTSNEGDRPIIQIVPANPQVIYLPQYDPAYIWGPPLYYPYANWFYPPRTAFGGAFLGFGAGISMGLYFGGGWGGWGGWGWHPGWGNRTVIVNNTFIHRYNFNSTRIQSYQGNTTWSHDSFHRQGVPYANQGVSERYGASVRGNLGRGQMNGNTGGGRGFQGGGYQGRSEPGRGAQPMGEQGRGSSAGAGQVRSVPTPSGGQNERMGNRTVPQNAPSRNRSAFGGAENGGDARIHTDHGYSSLGPARTAPTTRSAPQMRQAPQRSAPASRSSEGGRGRR